MYTYVVIWLKPASIQSFLIFLSLSVGDLQITNSNGLSINTSPNDSINSKVPVFLLYTISLKTQRYIYSNISAGEHYIYIKYRKDSSGNSFNDSLQFKVEIV